jgi:amidohydrolase
MVDYFEEARKLFEYMQTLRRDFHRHPELGFQEVRTSGIVARELKELGLEVRTGIAKTGVIANLVGKSEKPVILVRFDMDALPIQEENDVEYASQNPGIMHACGHDGHTAIGLSVARLLHAHRKELNGTVKFVFQPAEEGLGGAEEMVKEGVLENPKPDVVLALHLWNEKPVGWLGVTQGAVMAASDRFQMRIVGQGGHGAAPHLTVDPVLASCQIVDSLQSIISRNVPPLQSAVVSVTSIHGGEAFNVIPQEVELKGTLRSYERETRELIHKRFDQIVKGVAQSFGCYAEVETWAVTPAVINDTRITRYVQEIAMKWLPDYTLDSNSRTMGSEDMAYFMQDIPGCYFFIGSSNEKKGLTAAHHHPCFDFDEEVLPIATGLMATVVAEIMQTSSL